MMAWRESRRTTSSSCSKYDGQLSCNGRGCNGCERTSCSNEAIMMLMSEKRIRQVPEELLQQARNAIDIMIEVLGVSEV